MQSNEAASEVPDVTVDEAAALFGPAQGHPADLRPPGWHWVDVPLPLQPAPLAGDAPVRGQMDQAVLTLVKTGNAAAAKTLRDICLGLSARQPELAFRAFWQIGAAFFEALALQLCPLDVSVKRAISRVLMQYASMARGAPAAPERLAQELLSFCAQAMPAMPEAAPILAALRQAYDLTPPVDEASVPQGPLAPAPAAVSREPASWLADEPTKVIGALRLDIPVYNAYLNETDEWSRRLETELSEWALELHRPLPQATVALAQALANRSAQIGFDALADIARRLQQVLLQLQPQATGRPETARVLVAVAEHLRYLLHQFAAGFLRPPSQPLLDALDDLLVVGRAPAASGQAAASCVAVRSEVLDRLMHQCAEVMGTRARLSAALEPLRGSLGELTAQLDHLQQQAPGLESSGQMTASLNALAAAQRQLQRTIDAAEDELQTQAQQIQTLQRDLLRTRMVAFASVAERLASVVRQAAREAGKQVSLKLDGGALEIDQRVLERLVGVVEPVLAQRVAQGIEAPAVREQAGKPALGTITLTLQQEDGEVVLLLGDDGAGLAPELAGPDSGLEGLRAEVRALGGRIETLAEAAQGSQLKLVLPRGAVMMQVLLLRLGEMTIGVPAHRVERVEPAAGPEQLPTSVIFRRDGQPLAVLVDDVLGSQELLVSPPGPQLSHLPGLLGIAAQGAGAVTLIYPPASLATVYGAQLREPDAESGPALLTTA